MIKQIDLTKHVSSGLFVVYFCMMPVWLCYATWYQLLIGYFMYWIMTDVVQSLFMHRWVAHSLWNPPRWVQIVLSTVAVTSLIGTPITYSAWHRTHHAYTDTDKDPHSPTHKSWLYVIFAHYHDTQIRRAVDRMKDSYFSFLTKHMIYFVVIGNLMIFLLLPFVWFLTIWAIPVAYMIVSTNFVILVLSHRTGKAENLSAWYWPLVYDDGIHHAMHHEAQTLSYTNYDPAGFIVKKLGWVNEKI